MDKGHFDRIMSYIDIGKQSATLLTGGSRKGGKGQFIEPTIFVNPERDSRIVREEIFGPVLTIQTFKTEEEAVALANDSIYGLAGMMLFGNTFPLDYTLTPRYSYRIHQ